MVLLHTELTPVFPPFPPAPPGVAIIPYKEFKEHGIKVAKNCNGQEVDGAGIPTAMLPIREEPDLDFEWDSEPRHRPTPLRSHSSDRKSWWEYWPEQDDKRGPFAFNPQQPQLDRIYSALSSFRGSRRWPFERNGKPGPKYFWDQFRIFIGASGYPPAWNRTDKPKSKEKSGLASPDYSDEETDKKSSRPPASTTMHVSVDPVLNTKRKTDGPARPPYAHFNVKPVDVDSDEAVRELLELDKLRRDEHLIDFLEDPEKAVKVFLSSYSRGQSFWWSDHNLDIMPRVLCFFFRFLLKNRVFPDGKDERKYQNALRIAESAHKELPLTSVIAKFLPDQFSAGCLEYWGRQRKHSVWSDDEGGDTSDETEDDDRIDGALLVSDGTGIKTRITKITFDKCEDEGREAETSTPPTPISRQIPETLKTLLSLANPFPTSHTLGFAEKSLRRIKQVLPPGAFTSPHAKSYKPTSSDSLIDTIDAVEHDLETKLAKMILVPWTGSGVYGYDTPEILRRPAEIQAVEDELNEHDPLEDGITVLISVARKHLDSLRGAVGMGIAGTWVQLRPVGVEGMNSRRLKYWYLEEHNLVVPSFEAC